MAKKHEKPEKKSSGTYDATSITVLEGLDPVRRRPGMYIGGTGSAGLHHLVWEVVDNAIDEAMAGYCTDITTSLLPNHQVRVTDNGRGIPVGIHKQYKKSALELVMTKLHAGGKFGGGGYKVSGGLHGVGVSVVNALSIWTRAEVTREGKIWVQEYRRGKPVAKVKPIGKASGTGTTITFEPDPEVFKEIAFDWQIILDHLRQQAYLTKGVSIVVHDERDPKKIQQYRFLFEGGIRSYVRHLNHHKEPKHRNIFYVDKELEGSRVEIALQYVNDYKETIFAFANNIYNPEGGTHIIGFRTALTRTLNHFARTKGFLKEKDENLTGDDVREGMTAVISVKLQEPQFEGQTKGKLGNDEMRTIVDTVFSESFSAFLEENPKDTEAIIGKCILAAEARVAARVARDSVLRKGALEGLTLPGKLADCSTRSAEKSELFIVEGDSAGGCFSGDTRIALLDGRLLSFKELIEEHQQGKRHYCYTIKNDGTIGVGEIQHPRRTKRNAPVVKVTLDTGEEMTCTPDHQFLLRDGTYKQARDLTPQDSLMPLRRQLSRLGKRITIKGYAYNQTYLRKALAVLRDIYDRTGAIDQGIYNAVRRKTRDRSLIRLETIRDRFFDGEREKLADAVINYNHKIVSVVPLKEPMDVFDIEVPGTHNFALASGVFVHNSAKQGRDREFQAILPLRGKILNVERARIDKLLANNELRSLVIALGTNIGEQFDVTALRYNKIILMTDADVDGAHIRTLLLTLFWRYLPDLITTGHLYIAQPPLYRIQKGKEAQYTYSDEEKENILKTMEKKKSEKTETPEEGEEKIAGVSIQRYKGLGEMNPEQLWETTMDPGQRLLKQVTIEDAEKADEIFDILMGSEVAPRKHFIHAHAKNVKNLDI